MKTPCKEEHIEIVKREKVSRTETRVFMRCWVCGETQERIVKQEPRKFVPPDTVKIRKPPIYNTIYGAPCQHIWVPYSRVLQSSTGKPSTVYKCGLCAEYQQRED